MSSGTVLLLLSHVLFAQAVPMTPPAAAPRLLPLGQERIGDLALSPDGQLVAYTALDENDIPRLFVIPAGGGEALALTTGASDDATPRFSPDGRQIAFVSRRAGNADIFTVPAGGGTPKQITDDPAADLDPEWSADSQRLIFASSRTGNTLLYSVAATGGQVFPLTDGVGPDRRPASSPDGAWLAYESRRDGEPHIWVIPSLGGQARRLGSNGVADHSPSWTHDSAFVRAFMEVGKQFQLVFHPLEPSENSQSKILNLPVLISSTGPAPAVSRLTDRIVYLDPGGAGIRLTKFGSSQGARLLDKGVNRNPSWSSDGRRLVVSSNRRGAWDLLSVGVGTGKMDWLTDSSEWERSPGWMTPSNDLTYVVDSPKGSALVIYEPASRKSIQLVVEPKPLDDPVWSPDAKHIAYVSSKGGSPDVWIVQVGDGKTRRLTSLPGTETHPTWSPDGQWIAYSSDQGSGGEIWKARVDGEQSVRLTTLPGGGSSDSQPDWSRKNTWILFTRASKEKSEIYMVPVEGGAPFPLVREPGTRFASPAMSPAGDFVAYEWSRPDRVMVLDLPDQ